MAAILPVLSPPLALLAICGGAVLLVVTIAGVRRGVRSRRWPRVTGEVVHAEVVEHDSGDGDRTYCLALRYRYVVEGTTYEGTRRSFGGQLGGGWDAAEDERRVHRPGSAVRVYYDPAAPGEAVLEPGVGVWPLVGVPLSVALAAWGVWSW